MFSEVCSSDMLCNDGGGRLLVGVYCNGGRECFALEQASADAFWWAFTARGGGSASLLSMFRRAVAGGCLLQGGRECFALEHASAGAFWWAFTARGEGVLRARACFGRRHMVGVYSRGKEYFALAHTSAAAFWWAFTARGGGSASLLSMLRRAAAGGCLLQGEGVLRS